MKLRTNTFFQIKLTSIVFFIIIFTMGMLYLSDLTQATNERLVARVDGRKHGAEADGLRSRRRGGGRGEASGRAGHACGRCVDGNRRGGEI